MNKSFLKAAAIRSTARFHRLFSSLAAAALLATAGLAQAQATDGVCDYICIPTTAETLGYCYQDPADPDCGGIIEQRCYCTDGTDFAAGGLATSERCNAEATCANHDGWSQECHCNDGFVAVLGYGDVARAESCETDTTCNTHGGWKGGIGFGSCEGEFFTDGESCRPTIQVYDPDTGAVLVNDQESIEQQRSDLEDQAIDDVLALHGLPSTERSRLLEWERGRLRAQLFARLVAIAGKPADERTLLETQIHDWFQYVVWQDRIEPAQEAWNQYLGWKNAVDFASCAWQPPNQTYWVPKATADVTDPQFLDCQSDLSIPGLGNVPRLCRFNGCSAGADGIPRTDPSPNDETLAGDDGEACFASDPFTYDTCTRSRCAGVNNPLLCTFGTTAKPSTEQFRSYGAVLASRDFVYKPETGKSFTETSRGMMLLGALGVAAIGAAAAYTGTAAYIAAIAWYWAGTPGFAVANIGVSFLAPVGTVVVVVLAIAISVVQGLTLVESESVEGNLKADLRAVASLVDPARGKPDLSAMTESPEGLQELLLSFIKTASREPDPSLRVVPAPDGSRLWSVRDEGGTLLPDESGVDGDGAPRPIRVLSWPDAQGNSTVQEVGIFKGWFVIDTGNQEWLSLSLEYVRPNGEKWVVSRTQCVDETNASCTFGEPLFVHAHAGDTPPDGLDTAEVAAWLAGSDPTIHYKTDGGMERAASFNSGPENADFTVAGVAQEGTSLQFSATATDADGDGIAWSWNFGDSSPASAGSPVSHAFADDGSYEVKASPVDTLGTSGEAATQTVVVANVAPTATFTALPAAVLPGETVQLSLASAYDAGPADRAAGFTYSFDCTASGQLAVAGPSSGSAGCTFATPGAYTVRGRVLDKDGASTAYESGIQVTAPLSTLEQLRDLTTSYRLRRDRQWSLNSRLNRAIRRLNQGKPEVAVERLQVYVELVARHAANGALTEEQAGLLTTLANRIIASLSLS